MAHDISEIRKETCTGCGVCGDICPSKAVSMEVDAEGFLYSVINRDKCLQCGKCADVCPVSGNFLNFDFSVGQRDIYAAWSLDPEIRYQSTSGGIFSELALSILAEGGYICGAVYDGQHMVRHLITNKMEDLERLRQSKYVQSDMGDIYKKAAGYLQQGETLLFCGSPCQCAGVFLYCEECKINTERLHLVDFICRGANSPKVYRKYLKELEEKYHSHISKVWFKNKTYGWNHFCTKIEFENGEYYLQDRFHDAYVRGYIEKNLFIRPSCAICRFKGMNRAADLTLADFWGVKLQGNRKDGDYGISMVMLHTAKGKKLWDSITSRIYKEEKNLEAVISGNVCFENSVRHGVHREQFMKDLDRMPVIENIERFLR